MFRWVTVFPGRAEGQIADAIQATQNQLLAGQPIGHRPTDVRPSDRDAKNFGRVIWDFLTPENPRIFNPIDHPMGV